MNTDKRERITLSTLRERGWTPKLIERVLGAPDLEGENPHYTRAAPMKLYDLARVERAEERDDIRKVLAERPLRSARAKQGRRTHVERMKQWARTVPMEVKTIERAELVRRAREHQRKRAATRWARRAEYESRCWMRDEEPGPMISGSPETEERFERRITRNYVRHVCSPYDELLKKARKTNTGVEVYEILRERADEAVLRKYPWLRDPPEESDESE